MSTWVVTREASEGQPLVDALKQRGHEAVCVPAIRREPLPWPDRLTPAHGDIVFLTSPYAAKLALTHLRIPGLTLRWAAVAPATVGALAGTGVDVVVATHGGAVALAEACVAAGLRGRVLYPTSDAGLTQDEQAHALDVLSRECTVDRAAVYTTIDDPHLDDNLRLVQGRVRFHAVLFSPSAARALHASLVRTGVSGLAHVVTVGASTARAWPAQSIPAPAGVDIVDFVCSLEVK